jgi:hypothetical protein
MRRRLRNQLTLDLDGNRRRPPPEPAPEDLLNALADLLLEAFGNQNNAMSTQHEACDAIQNHA